MTFSNMSNQELAVKFADAIHNEIDALTRNGLERAAIQNKINRSIAEAFDQEMESQAKLIDQKARTGGAAELISLPTKLSCFLSQLQKDLLEIRGAAMEMVNNGLYNVQSNSTIKEAVSAIVQAKLVESGLI